MLLGGTDHGNDILIASEGDDTLYGDGGNDRLEGGAGNDQYIGGDGDDIITDLFGDDIMRTGRGHDAVNAGQGVDLVVADEGKDFIVLGADMPRRGLRRRRQRLRLGQQDHRADARRRRRRLDRRSAPGPARSATISTTSSRLDAVKGHDVFHGDGGFDEFIGEGGDDIWFGSLGRGKFDGMSGFDWATYDDMKFAVDVDLDPPDPARNPGPPGRCGARQLHPGGGRFRLRPRMTSSAVPT